MAQLSISVPSELQRWLDGRVAANGMTDAGEYVRRLIQRDQDEHRADVRRVQALIDEGIASGFVDEEPEDVIERLMLEIPARNG